MFAEFIGELRSYSWDLGVNSSFLVFHSNPFYPDGMPRFDKAGKSIVEYSFYLGFNLLVDPKARKIVVNREIELLKS